jgi:hypothetical protein
MSKKTYIQQMDDIIANKKTNGMVGIKFFFQADTDEAASDYEAMAKAFCKIEEHRAKGTFKSTTSVSV